MQEKQRTKIRYIKNNCLDITGINLSIQTMFDHMKIETNKKDLLDLHSQIPYKEEELFKRKRNKDNVGKNDERI